MLSKAAKIVDRLRAPALGIASAFGTSIFPKSAAPAPIRVPSLRLLLLEEAGCAEAAAVAAAVRTANLPIKVTTATIRDCIRYGAELRAGIGMPVGSADYVRACMSLAGITEPKWACYPRELGRYMLQEPRRVQAAIALAGRRPVFLKPVTGKAFNAFVLRAEADLDAAGLEHLRAFQLLSPSTPVWSAKALAIASEWRYYVLYGEVVGFARYAPIGTGQFVNPHIADIAAIIAAIPHDAAYAIDVAVLEHGECTVIALRDAWALQLLAGGANAPEPLDYLKLLWARWSQLVVEARDQAAANSLPQSAR